MTQLKVGVFGAGGRMGRTVCAAVTDDPDLELVAAVDRGRPARSCTASPSPPSCVPWPTRGATSWSTSPPPPLRAVTLPWLAMHGMHAVVGTTGFGDADLAEFRRCSRRQQLRDRPQLRDRRRADDALRRDGRAVLRDRRDHRAAPRPEDRRAVGHRGGHRRSAWPRRRRLGARPDPARGAARARAAASVRPASPCTRCACAAWWPTRR